MSKVPMALAGAIGVAILAVPYGLAEDRAAPQADHCTIAQVQALAGSAIHIGEVQHVAGSATAPAFCSVMASVDHGSRIGISFALPDSWNRTFLFFGVGGFGGILLPLNAPPLNRALSHGYATATTDTGHQGTDAKWALNNAPAVINHYESGIPLAARAAKALVVAYYGLVPHHSIFEGCSAGGRQAIVEAERFPNDFDGIIAEAPAWNYSKLLISFLQNGKEILKAPANWIPPQTFVAIDREMLRQCDAVDGIRDGIVADPRRCKLDLRKLLCKRGTRADNCLTGGQLAIIEKLRHPPYAKPGSGYFGYYLTGTEEDSESWGWPSWFFGTKSPMRDAQGKWNFAGLVLPETADRGRGPNQFILGEQFFRYIVMNEPNYDARSFDAASASRALNARLGYMLDADDTDLGRFLRLGGKLLIWHGWADPAIPPDMAIDLYERIRKNTKSHSGQLNVDDAVRLFMVPGVQHCGGGSGLTDFDPVPAVEQWMDENRAPERITAWQLVDGKRARSRPLCAYPKVAHYTGAGNPDDATNFVCK